MTLEQLAKQTHYTSDMQRYFLACIDEFGEDFKAFVQELVDKAEEEGYNEGCDMYSE